jgi:hypothetical protein
VSGQCKRVLDRLERGPATSWELGPALGVLRLSARVMELRAAGHEISWTERRDKGRRIVTYKLLGQAKLKLEDVA